MMPTVVLDEQILAQWSTLCSGVYTVWLSHRGGIKFLLIVRRFSDRMPFRARQELQLVTEAENRAF